MNKRLVNYSIASRIYESICSLKNPNRLNSTSLNSKPDCVLTKANISIKFRFVHNPYLIYLYEVRYKYTEVKNCHHILDNR